MQDGPAGEVAEGVAFLCGVQLEAVEGAEEKSKRVEEWGSDCVGERYGHAAWLLDGCAREVQVGDGCARVVPGGAGDTGKAAGEVGVADDRAVADAEV